MRYRSLFKTLSNRFKLFNCSLFDIALDMECFTSSSYFAFFGGNL